MRFLLHTFLCFLLLLCVAGTGYAQRRLRDLAPEDRKFIHGPWGVRSNVYKITAHLVQKCKTDEEKARALYIWTAWHIRYAYRKFKKGKLPPDDPKRVLRRRRAVCAGYARLYDEMCRIAGLPSVSITGYSKGATYRQGQRFQRADHVWNAVKTDGEWKLLDATWGSGEIVPRKHWLRKYLYQNFGLRYTPKFRYRRRVSMSWYQTPPEQMVESHLPIDPVWQLQDSAQVMGNFESVEVDSFPKLYQEWRPLADAVGNAGPDMLCWIQGENGVVFHPENEFDLAYGRYRRGGIPVKTSEADAYGDSLLWKEGILHLDSVPPALLRWQPVVQAEYRERSQELAALGRETNRTYRFLGLDLAFRYRMKRWKKMRALQEMRILKGEASGWGRQRRGFALKWVIKPDTVLQADLDVLDQGLRVQDSLAGVQRRAVEQARAATDSVAAQMELQADSLERYRKSAWSHGAHERTLFMYGIEYWAWKDLRAMTPVADSMHVVRERWQRNARELVRLRRKCLNTAQVFGKTQVQAARLWARRPAFGADSAAAVAGYLETVYRFDSMQLDQRMWNHRYAGFLEQEGRHTERWKKRLRYWRREYRAIRLEARIYLRAARDGARHRLTNDLRHGAHLRRAAAADMRTLKSWLRAARLQKRRKT